MSNQAHCSKDVGPVWFGARVVARAHQSNKKKCVCHVRQGSDKVSLCGHIQSGRSNCYCKRPVRHTCTRGAQRSSVRDSRGGRARGGAGIQYSFFFFFFLIHVYYWGTCPRHRPVVTTRLVTVRKHISPNRRWPRAEKRKRRKHDRENSQRERPQGQLVVHKPRRG
ncbi:hypothetical protein EDB83DRAFT_1157269 [Lactarius deliciosus]|nr:hypothetical protein EDB83DRAFT_1157269 [Lactarius deliciosus]